MRGRIEWYICSMSWTRSGEGRYDSPPSAFLSTIHHLIVTAHTSNHHSPSPTPSVARSFIRLITIPHTTMPPPLPIPVSATPAPFSAAHPIKLMTLRPNTWFALETFVEFIVVSYFVWALFYFLYLCVCGVVWIAKVIRDLIRTKNAHGLREDVRVDSKMEDEWEKGRGREQRMTV